MKTKGLLFAVMMFLLTSLQMRSQNEDQLVFGQAYCDGNGYCYVFNSDGTGAYKIFEEFEGEDGPMETVSQELTWTQDGKTVTGKRHIADEDVDYTLIFVAPNTLQETLNETILYILGKPLFDD